MTQHLQTEIDKWTDAEKGLYKSKNGKVTTAYVNKDHDSITQLFFIKSLLGHHNPLKKLK